MDFEQILMLIITTVLVPLLSWGVSVLIKLADAKIALIKNATVQQAFVAARQELASAVTAAVAETQQTFVEAIKDEGQFDKVAAKQAFDKSYSRVIEIMSNSGMAVLEEATGALNKLITAEIEKAVREQWS